ncbi:hypothetical protein [Mucilaginibacter sp.]
MKKILLFAILTSLLSCKKENSNVVVNFTAIEISPIANYYIIYPNNTTLENDSPPNLIAGRGFDLTYTISGNFNAKMGDSIHLHISGVPNSGPQITVEGKSQLVLYGQDNSPYVKFKVGTY